MQKKIFMRLFLCAEVMVFGWLYYQGARGVQAVQLLKQENETIVQQIASVQEEIEDIDRQIVAWNTSTFPKEKIAREQLHMARAGDEIYLLD